MGVLHYRDPGTGDWVPLSTAGPAGAPGPDEVSVSDTQPSDPNIELWVDRDNDLGNSGWTALDSRYINADGDAMTGALAMGGQKITGLGVAAAAGDAVSQQAGDARYLQLATGGTVAGAVTFSSSTAVPTPTLAGQAANKSYVDGRVVVATTAPTSPTTGQLWCPI